MVLYCWCDSNSTSILLYFTFIFLLEMTIDMKKELYIKMTSRSTKMLAAIIKIRH